MNSSTLISRLKANDIALTKVELSDLDEEYHVNEFLELFPQNQTITNVMLDRRLVNVISAEQYKSILKAVGQLGALQELEIWSCRVPLSTVCAVLRGCHTLKKLGLGFVGLHDMQSCEYLEAHPSLRHVYISEFRFAMEHTEGEDAASFSFNTFLRALATCPKLQTVEFFSSRVSDGDPWSSEALADLLDSPNLRSLTLRRLSLSSSGITALAEALHNRPHTSLKHLDLSENSMGDASSVSILQSAVRHSNLRSLSLRDNLITNVGCRRIADALLDNNDNRGLEKLNLTANAIGNLGAYALADVLQNQDPPTLQHLELVRTGITDDGCVALANAIRNNTQLLSLSLGYNVMTTPTFVAFAQALEVNRTLRSINLQAGRTNIDVEGVELLVNMLRNNFILQELSTFITDGADPWRKCLKTMVHTYLRLNKAGRQELMHGYPSKEEWISAIAEVSSDLYAVYYLVRAQPSICILT